MDPDLERATDPIIQAQIQMERFRHVVDDGDSPDKNRMLRRYVQGYVNGLEDVLADVNLEKEQLAEEMPVDRLCYEIISDGFDYDKISKMAMLYEERKFLLEQIYFMEDNLRVLDGESLVETYEQEHDLNKLDMVKEDMAKIDSRIQEMKDWVSKCRGGKDSSG